MAPDFDLHSLDPDPPTPSTVDVERAITDGRRRRARRRAGYVGAAVVTAVAVVGGSVVASGVLTGPRPVAGTPTPAGPLPTTTVPETSDSTPPPAPTNCTVDRLPVPDDVPMALTTGADPTGRWVVGRSYPAGGTYQAVIWHDGTPQKVPLPGDLEELLEDVNSTGTAVGWSYQGNGGDAGPAPYVYRDGEVSPLPGVERGSASAINEAGAIAGDSGGAPLLWPSATEQPARLPLPEGAATGTATDIDEDGTVVGDIDDRRPYVWFADGTHRELPLPALGGAPATSGRVYTIRNGWATGLVSGAGTETAVRWHVHTGEVRVFDQLHIRASTANAHGWQVGADDQGNAVLITDTATVVLPDLGGSGSLSVIPTTLSDDGHVITGQADDATGTIKAVVWHCE